MSLINPQLPKQYANGDVLFEQNLDAWRVTTESAFATVNLNLTQLRKDCFLATYDFDNDGNANLPKSLQQQINDLSTGATPLTGTTSDTWTINTDGNGAILSTAGLAATRTFTFPNDSSELVTINATQTLSNKTLSAPSISNAIMTGVTVFDAGTVLLPSITFTGDLNTGLYTPGADQLAVTLNGTQSFLWTTAYTFSVNPFYLPDGAVGAPGLAFNSDTDSGLFHISPNKMGLATGGSTAISADTTTVTIETNRMLYVQDGVVATPGIAFASETNSGIFRVALKKIGIAINGATSFSITDTLVTVETGKNLLIQDGVVATPGLSFDLDTDTGLFRSGANTMALVTGGSSSISTNTTAVTIDTGRTLYIQDGAAATPSFAFAADTNSGVYRGAADTYIFVANGNDQLQIEDGVVTIPVTTYLKVTNDNDPPNNTGEVTPRSLCKGWAKYTLANPTATLHNSYNVTSVTWNSNLSATVTWDNAFTSANYACVASLSGSNANAPEVEVTNYATTSIDINENGDGYLGEIASVAAFGVL